MSCNRLPYIPHICSTLHVRLSVIWSKLTFSKKQLDGFQLRAILNSLHGYFALIAVITTWTTDQEGNSPPPGINGERKRGYLPWSDTINPKCSHADRIFDGEIFLHHFISYLTSKKNCIETEIYFIRKRQYLLYFPQPNKLRLIEVHYDKKI